MPQFMIAGGLVRIITGISQLLVPHNKFVQMQRAKRVKTMRGTWSRREEEALLGAYIDAFKTAEYHNGRQLSSQGWVWIEHQLETHTTTPKTRASLTSKLNHLMRTYDLYEYLRHLPGARALADGKIDLDDQVWSRVFDEKPTDKDFLRQIRVSGCRHRVLCAAISAERKNLPSGSMNSTTMSAKARAKAKAKKNKLATKARASKSALTKPKTVQRHHHHHHHHHLYQQQGQEREQQQEELEEQQEEEEDEEEDEAEEEDSSDTEDMLEISDSSSVGWPKMVHTSFISPHFQPPDALPPRKMRRSEHSNGLHFNSDGLRYQEPHDDEEQQEVLDQTRAAQEHEQEQHHEENGGEENQDGGEDNVADGHEEHYGYGGAPDQRQQIFDERPNAPAPSHPSIATTTGARAYLFSEATEQSLNGLLVAATKYLEWKLAEERWREQKKRRNGRTSDLH